jgi:hypothetical protein
MLAMRRRGLERWAWAVPVFLAGFLVPFLWPYVVFSSIAKLKFFTAAAAILRTAAPPRKALESQSVRGSLLLISLLAISAAWVYSQVEPQSLGSCHEIALYVGSNPTARDCQPYGAPELAIAVGALLGFWVLLGGGDVSLPIPGMSGLVLTRTRRAKEVVDELRQDQDLEQRLAGYSSFRETLATEAERQGGL